MEAAGAIEPRNPAPRTKPDCQCLEKQVKAESS